MRFDLGTHALRKALTPRPYTLRCKVLELHSDALKVQATLNAKDEKHLTFWAKPLLPLSFSYEVDDDVIVEVRSLCESFVLGLAAELDGTNIEDEFHIRLGKNILKGRKDGKQFSFTGGDGNFKIEHTLSGTTVETKGTLTLTGDMVMLADAMGLALNMMTPCPLAGQHGPMQQKCWL